MRSKFWDFCGFFIVRKIVPAKNDSRENSVKTHTSSEKQETSFCKVPRVVHFVVAGSWSIEVIYSSTECLFKRQTIPDSRVFLCKLGWFSCISIVAIKANDISQIHKYNFGPQKSSARHSVVLRRPLHANSSPSTLLSHAITMPSHCNNHSFDWERSLIESFLYSKLTRYFIILRWESMRQKRLIRQFATSSDIFTFDVWAKWRRKFIDSFIRSSSKFLKWLLFQWSP